MTIQVIGGAGFIGGHLVDALIQQGEKVQVIDNLDPLVHPAGAPPSHLPPQVEFHRLDVRDRAALLGALEGVESVFYLGGAVGVADSMYRISHYVGVNSLGAANFLDILANEKHTVRRVILASSVTVYGEGKYACPVHGPVHPGLRPVEQTSRHDWEAHCSIPSQGRPCGAILRPLPTSEEASPAPESIYAMTKRNQEEMFLAVGRAYGIPVVVLRYFNVYGPRQALSNPYTGVAKIFAAKLARGEAPTLYEDGLQSRDFVHVDDIVQACLLALRREAAWGEIFNVGTGRQTTILELANVLGQLFGYQGEIKPAGLYRVGDVRHCFADITKIRAQLGFAPRKVFPAGLEDLLQGQILGSASEADHRSAVELGERGLVR